MAPPNQQAREAGPAVPVTLHLYDVTGSEAVSQLNGLFKAVGTGAFHAGIEVHSREWSYGFSDGGGSGVFDCEPRRCSMHTYRESIVVGWCRLSEEAVLALIAELSEQWLGGDYDLIRQNCCHFSDCLARRLGAGRLPERVTSLAAVGAAVDDGVRAAAARAAAAGAVAGELDQRYQVSATAGELAAGALETANTLDEQYKVTATAGALATEAADKAGVLMFEVDKRYNVTATAREFATGAVSRAGKLEEEYRVVSATGTLLDQLSEAVVTAAEQAPQWMGRALQLSTSQAPLSCSQSSRTDHSAAAVQRPRC